MGQSHEGKRFLYPGFVFRHISFQERWSISRQGGISSKITNVPNKFIKSHVSKKKGNSEKGAVFSRKVGSIQIGLSSKYQVYFRSPRMLYISMVISRLTGISLKKGTFWKVYSPCENRHKIIMIRVNTKKESSQKRGIFESSDHI
jgi:hypothetical protein